MLARRVIVCFALAPVLALCVSPFADAQLETDPLPPEPPIDLGGVLTTPDPVSIKAPPIEAPQNYSRSMRARQLSINEPGLRTTVTLNTEQDAPPPLTLWDTTPLPGSHVRTVRRTSPIVSVDRRLATASYETPVATGAGLATPIVDPQPYIPSVEHIPTVAYESYPTNPTVVSQPTPSVSYAASGCSDCGVSSCGGGCLGGSYYGGGIFGNCLAGYGQANALPLGAPTNAYFEQQIYNGERSRYTLYHYDFFDEGTADPSQLNRAGRTKLAKLVTPKGNRSFVAHQIIVQPILNRPALSQARRAAVLQFLSSRLGANYGESQVVLAEPDYRGLRGVEAVEIDRNQLQNTRSFGSLGAGNQFGGGGGGGGQGIGQGGGTQTGGGLQSGQR